MAETSEETVCLQDPQESNGQSVLHREKCLEFFSSRQVAKQELITL